MSKKARLREVLENLTKWGLVGVWNEYCDSNYYDDDRIYRMGDFDDLMSRCSPTEVVESINSNFSTADDWCRATAYGWESFDDVEDVIEMDDLIDYILDNESPLGCDDIRYFLDEESEIEEEDAE